MQLGTAKLAITPQTPVRLCGYATRTATFEQVKEDLFLRIQLHRHERETLLFIYADLLWWGSDFVAEARQKISGAYDIAPERIFFVASHNHSGPPTCNLFTPSLETYDHTYARFLQERVLEGVALAAKDMEQVEARRHDGSAALNVFRRVMEDGKIQMRPNYQVSTDRTLTIAAFRRPDGSLKAAMVHYPCHANLSNENAVQPDYPGVALRLLDEAFPGSVSIFLQGCTADLRPNSVLGQSFVPADYKKVLVFAGDFFQACSNLLARKADAIIPHLCAKRQLVELPLEGVLPLPELEQRARTREGVELEWARAVLAKNNRPSEQLELSWIDYGDRLRFYTFNAEVSQYYAAFARSADPHAVCIAYTNGMIGYLSTAEQIEQGGYEPVESALYFALAGTYKPEIEQIIHGAMRIAAAE
ncbi:hypothetical protein EDC14_10505 [Hydrogenispora ethanolica]|uniref:Neutral/alkaline ceramidase-like enzyme n=1 Tax=Hydrogenispora ethanolica TaxID=1082276 RepID=A0A4V6NGL8_HYDET|nr:alkaline ceramidase [Hydrogenispora ethanolica]TCL56452.1 hypothetical protein EDC14_10505 [Hydrogenispora ethanolica]